MSLDPQNRDFRKLLRRQNWYIVNLQTIKKFASSFDVTLHTYSQVEARLQQLNDMVTQFEETQTSIEELEERDEDF